MPWNSVFIWEKIIGSNTMNIFSIPLKVCQVALPHTLQEFGIQWPAHQNFQGHLNPVLGLWGWWGGSSFYLTSLLSKWAQDFSWFIAVNAYIYIWPLWLVDRSYSITKFMLLPLPLLFWEEEKGRVQNNYVDFFKDFFECVFNPKQSCNEI